MNKEVLLRVENLCQYFKGTKAVDDVSFEVMKGEVFGLVGESGCGKTTTGRAIIKLYNITSGNIIFKGKRISAGTLSYKLKKKEARKKYSLKVKELKAEQPADIKQQLAKEKEALKALIEEQNNNIRKAKLDQKNCDAEYKAEEIERIKAEYDNKLKDAKNQDEINTLKHEMDERIKDTERQKLVTQIQMIFQDSIASLDPRMTVREIVAEGLVIRGIKDREYIDEQVYRVLELVGLVRDHAGRYPHEFSGGQRQRIGVARSIIMNPELIIADEPVSALDVSIQAQVINLLNDLRHELGLTILFIAHDLSVVKYFSDRIGVMYYGHIVELTSSDELFKKPLHPYTKSLLSAIPLPDPNYEKKRKRIVYNPIAEHDYSTDAPSLREVAPGHFVRCNDAEFEKYRSELEHLSDEQ